MLDQIKALLRRQDSCVLATIDGESPHCSLMAYVADDAGKQLYLITSRNTRKYRNLTRHPRVSLLIDTRNEQARDAAQALTVTGECTVLNDAVDIARLKAAFARRHAHLGGFLQKDDLAVICVRIESFLLLSGPESAGA